MMLSRLFCYSIFLLKPICEALLLPKPSCSKASRLLTFMSSKEPNSLLQQAVSWSATNGLIYTDGAYVWGHAPLSLLPSSFPRESFEYMKTIQPIFNTLVDKISRDKDFIMSTLYQAAQSDEFTRRLLKIYDTLPRKTVTESINLGIHRSDYMLQQDDQPDGLANKVLQVEINTIASSFGCLSSRVGNLHKYLLMRNAGRMDLEQLMLELDVEFSSDSFKASKLIPENPSIRILAVGLALAHFLFGDTSAVVLFVVQPGEKNFVDQRHLENELWTAHGVQVEFLTLAEVKSKCKLRDGKILSLNSEDAGGKSCDVSVVYFRSGYAPTDYPSENEWKAREMIEISNAMKCPSVAYQLTGAKAIQQKLCEAGVLESFLGEDDCKELRKCFVDQYSLGLDNDMKDAAKNAMNDAILDGSHWVLKPQREGGGNNMYGKAVSEYLSANRNCSVLSGYVLMRRIFPVVQKSAFLRGGNLQILPSVSEYGTYGVFLGDGNKTPIINAYAGYLVRTKPSGVDEGGVATGFSVLNSLVLSGSDGPEADFDFENGRDEASTGTSMNSDWNWNAQNLDEIQKLFVDIVLDEKKQK